MDAPPRTRSRVVRGIAVAFAAGLLLSFVPLPTPSFVTAAVTERTLLPLDRPVGASEVDRQRADAEVAVGDQRVAGVVEDTGTFDTLGVTLDEVPDGPVLVRVRDAAGAWGEWNEVEVEVDSGPDPGSDEAEQVAHDGKDTVAVTEPIWVGEATGYEVSVDAADADAVEVAVVREETQRVVAEAVPFAEAMAAPFGINSRATWGARSPKRSASTASSGLQLAVVHHTASSNNYSQAQVPGILRSIQSYHMDANGWSDIGYNFLVDRFGGIWEGRAGGTGNAVIGAHAAGFNTGSVGVAVLGNYVSTTSSAAAREAVSRVIGYRLQRYGIHPQSRRNITSLGSNTIPAGRVVNLPAVVGHQNVGATACPGSLQGLLGSMSARATDWFNLMDHLSSPRGGVDSVRVNGRTVEVGGWAIDPDVPNRSARVHVVLGGRLREIYANGYRPDVGRAHGVGDHRGFGIGFFDVPPGTHRLCVTGINQGYGRDALISGCRDVVVK